MGKVAVEIREKLNGQLEEIAEEEEMTLEEVIDHALRSYVEGWPYDTDEEGN